MTIAVAIAAVFTACLINFLRSEGWIRRPIELAPPPPWANPDHVLFDIVFSDLIGDTESGNAGGGTGPQGSRIVVDSRSQMVTTLTLEEVLGNQTKNIPAEIRVNLVSRNSHRHGYSLAEYHPSNTYILVHDSTPRNPDIPSEVQYPNVRGCVMPTLPGYSHDGRMALVCFACDRSFHGDAGYYLLRKVKERWEIVLKGFHFFRDGF